jgi:UDP-N-acetylmuramyl tripeptide synthase
VISVNLRLSLAIVLGKATAAVSRALGLGGGTTMPGRVARAVAPDVLRQLAARLPEGCVLVTGTNGKTTTSRLISHILHLAGTLSVHNRAGANLVTGIIAALVGQATWRGHLRGIGIFEVDEATLPTVWTALRPRAVVLTNLFRDQLDRYGEIDLVSGRWRAALHDHPLPDVAVIYNADDPLVAEVGVQTPGRRVPFGIADPSCGVGTLEHAADGRYCFRCGIRYQYSVVYFGHMGIYRCPQCGTQRPDPSVAADAVELTGIEGSAFTLRTPSGRARVHTVLPGVYNIHNVLAAAACCLQLGTPLQAVVQGIETFAPAFGRAEHVHANGREAVLLLAKNPAGFNEVLRTVMRATGSQAGVVLLAINDLTADGRDISWLWDVDFEMLTGRSRAIVVSGRRAEDMALRLKHAGVSAETMLVHSDLGQAWDAALDAAQNGEMVYVLPTYTALLQLRTILQRRGLVGRFWEQ